MGGSWQIASRPGDIRKSYDTEMRKFIQSLLGYARARNIDYNFVTTETPYSEVLRKYLLRRGSR